MFLIRDGEKIPYCDVPDVPDGNTAFRYEDKQPRNPRSGERVQKEVVSVRFTPETLDKLAELASQSNMSRNQLIESVVCEYVQAEFPTEDEAVDATDSAPETEVQGDDTGRLAYLMELDPENASENDGGETASEG